MNKAQRLLKNYIFYNKPLNNSSADYLEYKQAKKELGDYLIMLAFQGRLYSRNTNGFLQNVNVEYKFSDSFERIDDTILYTQKLLRESVCKELKSQLVNNVSPVKLSYTDYVQKIYEVIDKICKGEKNDSTH